MNAAIKNKIVYKINVMILSCFSVKILFLVLVCIIASVLYVNLLHTITWNSFPFSNRSSQSMDVKVILKNNDVLPYGIYKSVLELTQCYDRPLTPLIQLRGDFWVLYNYVRAENQHRCFESVTYTTQGDYTFLDNVIPLVERWKGPISIALHSPGDDFKPTLDSIAYLRNCETPLIKQYVTFHLFFGIQHIPNITSTKPIRECYEDTYNCDEGAPFINKDYKDLYKTKSNLTYPINVARNVARITAQTHFVLASDIELYPSRNLISKFLLMVTHRRQLFEDKSPKIFVLPVFEVLANQTAPSNKTALQKMIKNKTAFSFHRKLCMPCHEIPYAKNWLNLPEKEDLNIFITVKRQQKQSKWEAFYIGTNDEPIFDERLTWEGQSNKMIQAYALCLLNYDYMVLDNAFLVHKPGLKKKKFQNGNYYYLVLQTNKLISTQLKTEMNSLYGARNGCLIS